MASLSQNNRERANQPYLSGVGQITLTSVVLGKSPPPQWCWANHPHLSGVGQITPTSVVLGKSPLHQWCCMGDKPLVGRNTPVLVVVIVGAHYRMALYGRQTCRLQHDRSTPHIPLVCTMAVLMTFYGSLRNLAAGSQIVGMPESVPSHACSFAPPQTMYCT